MMNLEVVQAKTVDGIELYISKNGKKALVSVSGLARLAGTHQSAMSNLLLSIERNGKNHSKSLEHLQGKLFDPSVTSDKGAKMVNADAVADIIYYFAIESKIANDTAKKSLKAFNQIGVTAFIKKLAGYQEEVKPTDDANLMQLLTKLLGKVDNIERKLDGYSRVATIYPAFDTMAFESQPLMLPSGNLYSVREWLDVEHPLVDLTKSQYFRLCADIAFTIKTLQGYVPEFKLTKKQTKIRVYREGHWHLMDVALRQVLEQV